MRGATMAPPSLLKNPINFNPRTPCGVRLVSVRTVKNRPLFQSTHPMRGATRDLWDFAGSHRISIHAPHAGCDPALIGLTGNSHKISIHAPHAGCDTIFILLAFSFSSHFNPRTPCGVRRSIDTSRRRLPAFQSTHPMRGATAPPSLLKKPIINFNPRTPCGVRRCLRG